VRENLVNRIGPIASGPGWREERTGLHELEFIETRRHWFRGRPLHLTGGSVNVLNLVEGDEAIVESPRGLFDPLVVHYAETFIVPAALGDFSVRPHGPSEGRECATIPFSFLLPALKSSSPDRWHLLQHRFQPIYCREKSVWL
jgi:hypothetical protein